MTTYHGDWAAGAKDLAKGVVLLGLRAVALLAYVVLALAEPFIGVVLSAFAFGCFAVAVLFGFILRVPFAHRWEVLALAVVSMLLYGLYLGVLGLLQRCLR